MAESEIRSMSPRRSLSPVLVLTALMVAWAAAGAFAAGRAVAAPAHRADTQTRAARVWFPLMMGMWTRIQAASRTGTGFADPDIYAVGDTTDYARDFNDYTIGTNGAYQAATGWDYVSGWGTPVLTPLMKDIDSGNTAPIQGR